MSTLPYQTIRALGLVSPCREQRTAHGMTYGLGPASYDVRIAEDVLLWPKGCALASTIERVEIPNDIQIELWDKSTWARRFVSASFHTLADPGFRGWITLEINNHSWRFVRIKAGMPIAKFVFKRLEEPTDRPYDGKYQDQGPGPQPARFR